MGNQKKRESFEKGIEELLPPETSQEKVTFSLILPVYNCADVIGRTLQSVMNQKIAPAEVIVIDAGSTDHTLDIINRFPNLISRVYTVTQFHIADMINRGISFCTSDYVMVVLPGTYYLSDYTYLCFQERALEAGGPDLIYCGSIQREVHRVPVTIFSDFDETALEKGENPAVIPACWFRLSLFSQLGKFNTRYTMRAGYDLFCRVAKTPQVKTEKLDRIFIDFDYGRFSYGKILRFAHETWRIMYHHFGFMKAFRWFLTTNHWLLIEGLWRRFTLQLSRR